MLVRVRSQVGVWRLGVSSDTTIAELRKQISQEHNVDLMTDSEANNSSQPLTLKPNAKGQEPPLPLDATLGSLGLNHGDMLHLNLSDTSQTAAAVAHEEAKGGKKVNKDGSIVQQTYEDLSKKKGFRPGMMSLRSMKMKWTLNDFVAMDDQFVFKIKRQDKAVTTGAVLDSNSCNSFQSYVRQFAFHRSRVAFLYGTFEDSKAKVECMYEPPQNNTAEGFELLDDPMEDRVEALAKLLKLERVGWMFAHPPREEGFLFSGAEVLTAAELQLEAANGVQETPFVTVKVTATEEGEAHFDAFQVSLQCMEMVAESAIDVGVHPGSCAVSDSFTAVVEGKEAKEIDNSFFLTVVPIEQHSSELLVSTFPKAHREGTVQTWECVKSQLQKAGSQGFQYIDLLADFHLLLFLSEFLDIGTDLPRICASITDKSVPLEDGFKLIINNMAGLDD